MEFFDKKEDVIDMQLTQFGRHLLSKGKFKPVFYSFFDDNVIYDISTTGLTEEQNDAEERIKQTPLVQPQACFSSLEKEFNTSYESILSKANSGKPVVEQKTAEKNYSLPQPLGTADVDSEYIPAWSLRYLNGFISGSTHTSTLELQEKNGGKNVIKIPQLTTHVKVKMVDSPPEDSSQLDELFDGPSLSNVIITSDPEEYTILLKVSELNGAFQKKNFDIEFFEVVEEVQNNTTMETLRPLYFSKPFNPEEDNPYEDNTPQDSQDHVAHYIDLKIDDEIDSQMLCKLDPASTKMGVYADERTELCQDILNKQNKKSFNIYDEGAEGIPGDIC
jgi:hypothetical protein